MLFARKTVSESYNTLTFVSGSLGGRSSDFEPETCVYCGKTVPVSKDTPITERKFYIEGAGQLCEQCFDEIYEKSYR